MISSLEGLIVLDLSRILAGPSCTQILGDLGATIIKVERPNEGDDTRLWGPPYLKDSEGRNTHESAYYLSCNRNKQSITLDLSKSEGQDILHALAAKADILVHNFKVGSLEKYGLGYDVMHTRHPHLIYTAISGFGQTGPMAKEPGYDLMAQAMGGLMGHTGADGGEPFKSGVAVVDVMTGLYAAVGTLAALNARHQTGKGQLVDVALLDVSLASMTNLAQYFLTSGHTPKRYGNAHATIVPYQSFETADGHMVVAVGNDGQFTRLCDTLGHSEWATDARFAHNDARVQNRDILIPMMANVLKTKPAQHWVDALMDHGIPASAVNSIDKVFAIEQIQHRGMEIKMSHPYAPAPISLVGSPLHLSDTPVTYRTAPPVMGADTKPVLQEFLGLDDEQINALKSQGIV